MITVADIIALPAFERIELAAPCAGAGAREVRNVGILDLAPDEQAYADYLPGEFIASNLGFARDDAALAEASLLALIRRNVAAVAVKNVYHPHLSEAVRSASTAMGVPLYLYEGAYHEVLAYQALDLIRRDGEESDKGRMVDALLAAHDSQGTRTRLYQLTGAMGATLQCLAVAPRNADECSLYAALDALAGVLHAFKADWASVDTVFACRYHDLLLAFVSYAQPPASVRAASEADLVARIQRIGPLWLGVGEEGPLSDGDLSVREALAALKTARTEGDAVACWADLHHDAFRAAAAASRLFGRTAAFHRALLEEYDAENDAELAPTAEALARAYGDVRAAAEQLHQHPNTVRYRLRRAKAVLGMPDAPDREFAFLLGLVFLDRTNPLLGS